MLNRQVRHLTYVALLADGLTLGVSFLLANYFLEADGEVDAYRDNAWLLLIIFPLYYIVYSLIGQYRSILQKRLYEIHATFLKGSVISGVILASFFFLLKLSDYRNFFLYFLSISTLFLLFQKTGFVLVLKYYQRNGFRRRHLVIVGTGGLATRFIRCMDEHLYWGLKIVGVVGNPGTDALKMFSGYPVLGAPDDLVEICRKSTVDEVVFCESSGSNGSKRAMQSLEEMGIKVQFVFDTGEFRGSCKEVGMFHREFPIVTISSKPVNENHMVLKRILDVVGSLVGLFILGVLLPFIAVAIRLESKGPIFFGQDRVGENGRIFKCWKFRSMFLDAEARRMEIAHLNEMSGGMFKVRDDPRITQVGRFLRKLSLDEWPQFWNVLKGEMSLVGPRPLPIGDIEMNDNRHRRRLSVKPGITGAWQVSGRSEITDFQKVVQLDLDYIDKWNFWLDFRILLKTCLVVFTGHGSY